MKEGINKELSFKRYESRRLNLKLPTKFSQYNSICNCGTAALSLLTGMEPNYVQDKCTYESGDGWYSEEMVKFLRNRKFKVVEVTKHNVTKVYWKDYPLTNNHCLLIISQMDSHECSAVVVHKNKLWHNMKETNLSPIFFLNKPTIDVYIVSHSKWN